MGRTLDVVSVKVSLLVPAAATVKMATDEHGKTIFEFGWVKRDEDEGPPFELRTANADLAVGRFLEARNAHEFYRVFKDFGPLKNWSKEPRFPLFREMPAEQISLEEVLAVQSSSRLMRERGTYKKISELLELIETQVPAEAMNDSAVLAVNGLPAFEASWQSPVTLRTTCRGMLEALSCTLFLDQANDRSRVFCARAECGKTFLRRKGDKRIYHERKCGVKVAKAKLRAQRKKKAQA